MPGIREWFKERLPVSGVELAELTNEPVPNHLRRWWFCLGGTPAYRMRPGLVSWAYERAQFAYKILDAKYYVDEIYDFVFVRGSILISRRSE